MIIIIMEYHNHFKGFLHKVSYHVNPILPDIVPIGTQKKHIVSNWSMDDLEASDWLKFLIFVKYFFFKNVR